jgi:hypothetical protein
MKRTDYKGSATDSSREEEQDTGLPAEEFIGLDDVGEFPEWRSPEEEQAEEAEEESSRPKRRLS